MNNTILDANKKDSRIKRGHAEVYFEHLGREIIFRFSLYSGKERVFVDGKLVSETRNWYFTSAHRFQFEGTQYEVQIAIKKSLKGLLIGESTILLKADGQLIDSDEFSYMKASQKGGAFSWKKFFFNLVPYFIIGAVVGFSVSYFSINLFS